MSPRLVYRPEPPAQGRYVDPLLSLLVGQDVELVDPPTWMPNNRRTSSVRPVGSSGPALRVPTSDLLVLPEQNPTHASCELEPLCESPDAGLTTTREHEVDCIECLSLLALVQDEPSI